MKDPDDLGVRDDVGPGPGLRWWELAWSWDEAGWPPPLPERAQVIDDPHQLATYSGAGWLGGSARCRQTRRAHASSTSVTAVGSMGPAGTRTRRNSRRCGEAGRPCWR